jgi:hypothetical protein
VKTTFPNVFRRNVFIHFIILFKSAFPVSLITSLRDVTNSMSDVLLQKLTVTQSRNSPPFIEHESLLPCSQVFLVIILSQMNPVHNVTIYFVKINFNNILQPIPKPPTWSLPLKFR